MLPGGVTAAILTTPTLYHPHPPCYTALAVKRRVQLIAGELASSLATWPGVEAVTLGEAAAIEVFDPYFVIDLDVYHRAAEPPPEERRLLLGDPAGFETIRHRNADRFLVDELPVRIQHMDTGRIDLNLARALDSSWVYHRETGTNLFFRVQRSQLLFERTDWYTNCARSLGSLPPAFWEHVKAEGRSWVEGALQDLSAAAYRSDDVFFLVAASRFVRSICAFLFAANGHFEPEGRMIHKELVSLASLPSEFVVRFDSFVRQSPPLSPDKRREIAELLARSILSL